MKYIIEVGKLFVLRYSLVIREKGAFVIREICVTVNASRICNCNCNSSELHSQRCSVEVCYPSTDYLCTFSFSFLFYTYTPTIITLFISLLLSISVSYAVFLSLFLLHTPDLSIRKNFACRETSPYCSLSLYQYIVL